MAVRTHRLGLSPFAIGHKEEVPDVLSTVESISSLCRRIGIRWFVVPLDGLGPCSEETRIVALQVTNDHKNAFVNYLATAEGQIGRQAVGQAAQYVRDASLLSPNGIDNFRCGVSFNTRPNGAFFPFMFHEGEQGFSVALELTGLCVAAIEQCPSRDLENVRSYMLAALVPAVEMADLACRDIERLTGRRYFGIDASLAPHPERNDLSVGYLFSLLGVKTFGDNGTTFIAAFVTDILKSVVKRSGVRATGFCGVMYSVLEDRGLAEANLQPNGLPMSQLLALSAVCGCGLDMIPVPGDVTWQELAGVMLDVGALATWLDKPLGVRLLPIPRKAVGELTRFDHDFLVNTRIQEMVRQDGLGRLLDSTHPFAYTRDQLVT